MIADIFGFAAGGRSSGFRAPVPVNTHRLSPPADPRAALLAELKADLLPPVAYGDVDGLKRNLARLEKLSALLSP